MTTFNIKEVVTRLKNTLEYIIDRGDDFNGLNPEDEYDIDDIICDYITSDCSDFYVIIKNRFFRINARTLTDVAQYVLDNVKDEISNTETQYIYDIANNIDTVVGNVTTFLNTIDNTYLLECHYRKAVREIAKPFTKEDVTNKIFELFNNKKE